MNHMGKPKGFGSAAGKPMGSAVMPGGMRQMPRNQISAPMPLPGPMPRNDISAPMPVNNPISQPMNGPRPGGMGGGPGLLSAPMGQPGQAPRPNAISPALIGAMRGMR